MKITIARPGDSLVSVARRCGLSCRELAHINGLGDPHRLTPGLALAVPGSDDIPRKSLEISASPELSVPGSVLSQLLPELSYICPFSLVPQPDGTLPPSEDSRLVEQAAQAGVPSFLTLANLDENGSYSAALAHTLLGAEETRRALLDNILCALKLGFYSGVHLSFCYLHPFDRDNYNAFLQLAAPALHAGGWYLSTALAPREDDSERSLLCSAHDYAAHGSFADRVLLLAYDWGYAYSAPQAVSPINRIRAVLDYAAGKLPLGKLSLAVSGQGYSWTLTWRLGDRASQLPHSAAMNLAISKRAEVRLDALSQNSTFTYTDNGKRRHVVWFEDVRSMEAKLRLIEDYGLAGLHFAGVNRLDRPALNYIQSQYSPERLI